MAPRSNESPYRSASPVLLLLIALALLLFPLAPGARAEGATGSLVVAVADVANDDGTVVIALFDSQEDYDSSEPEPPAVRSAFLPIAGRKATITFENLPFGDYAMRLFHDENDNKELDTNWVGFPKEGYGFSNDAMGAMGPPSFDEAKFKFEKDGQVTTVHMK